MNFNNLLRCLKRSNKNPNTDLSVTPHSSAVDSGSRALEWLGKESFERQQFYENWAARESWFVYDEGLCLLLGRDPDDEALSQDNEFVNQRQIFWEHLQHCVSQRVPPVLNNPAADSKDWRVEPVELYRWAIAARVPMPPELDTMLAFISSMVPARPTVQPQVDGSEELTDNSESIVREQVLSIMLSLSLQAEQHATQASPDEIRDRILDELYAGSKRYFNSDEPPLSRPALHDLLDRSLENAGLIHMANS